MKLSIIMNVWTAMKGRVNLREKRVFVANVLKFVMLIIKLKEFLIKSKNIAIARKINAKFCPKETLKVFQI